MIKININQLFNYDKDFYKNKIKFNCVKIIK